jgi:hypothetical protein
MIDNTNIYNNTKIIASFASINVDSKNKFNTNIEGKFIENVVASIIKYDQEIDFNKVVKSLKFLNDNTSFSKNKKFIVINIGLDFEYEDKILIDNKYIKIIEMHLYQFLRYCSVNNNKYEYSKLQ